MRQLRLCKILMLFVPSIISRLIAMYLLNFTRVYSALKDMAVVMKQLDRFDEEIEPIKYFRSLCLPESQDSLDNVLVELYKRPGRIEEEIEILQHKLTRIEEGISFGGKRWKFTRCQGRSVRVTVDNKQGPSTSYFNSGGLNSPTSTEMEKLNIFYYGWSNGTAQPVLVGISIPFAVKCNGKVMGGGNCAPLEPALDVLKFLIPCAPSGKAWDNLLDNKDYRKEERSAMGLLPNETLHGASDARTFFGAQDTRLGVFEDPAEDLRTPGTSSRQDDPVPYVPARQTPDRRPAHAPVLQVHNVYGISSINAQGVTKSREALHIDHHGAVGSLESNTKELDGQWRLLVDPITAS
ncbi:hypothetical protein QQ045_010286 [Rhodiola kirilowii]